ncbi:MULTISPECIES: Tim44/TimA family putative adaptor protein [Methylosinus]|uniref:Tim44 domain-containing protein n=1 Tax=Methylosinus trichosporium (strain ATCC 35070 / NCIMB 11131 / UNIQEM 75 / OB3b) TaxID=595536 RepID=A0A2D2D0Y6_METT3|nr:MULTISPECIES: Tim44/TimA family putative adaptor protein [Methylosinus]ATQ68665.1 Tim44 domain-containing protein [Methylosinus trichosporium OB3b]OBS53171.1 preprotein translocase subunit Tim44 [Methylosinus sp. 3S-1]
MPANEAFDPSILVLAALAAFVVWKLWSVLGVRTDRENSAAGRVPSPGRRFGVVPPPASTGFAAPPQDQSRWDGLAEPGSKGWAGLDALAAADRGFDAKNFLEGAKKAYELVVESFAKGDREMLRNLLANDVYDSFAKAIAAREQRGESAEARVVAIETASVEDAQVERGRAQVAIRFVVKLISARRDSAGEVIEGDVERPIDITDLWTFARDISSRDPNWKLVATETIH